MKILDVIKQKDGDVETIGDAETLRHAVDRFTRVPVRGLVVVDGDRVVGMLTMRDILRFTGSHDDALQRPVHEAMSHDLATVGPHSDLEEVEKIIVARRVNHVPVIDAGKLVGVVTLVDVLRTHLDETTHLNADLHQYIHGSYAV